MYVQTTAENQARNNKKEPEIAACSCGLKEMRFVRAAVIRDASSSPAAAIFFDRDQYDHHIQVSNALS